MDEDDPEEVAALGRVASPTDRRSEAAFVLAEAAFDLPALTVSLLWEAPRHLATIAAPGKLTPRPSPRRRDDRPRSKVFAHEAVVLLAVIAGVGEKFIERLSPVGLRDRLIEFAVIRKRAAVGHGGEIEMTARVADGRELRISASLPATTLAVVGAPVTGFEARGIDGGLRNGRSDYAAVTSDRKGCIEEFAKAPFFSRRFSA